MIDSYIIYLKEKRMIELKGNLSLVLKRLRAVRFIKNPRDLLGTHFFCLFVLKND